MAQQRVFWDDASSWAASQIRVARPAEVGHYFFHAEPIAAPEHWVPAANRSALCTNEHCQHCRAGIPTRREWYAPTSLFLNAVGGKPERWVRLVLQIAPSLRDKLTGLFPLEGQVVTIEAKTQPGTRFRRYGTKPADHLLARAPRLDPFDVRPIVEAHFGVPTAPVSAGAAPDVAGELAAADGAPEIIPFRKAAAG